MPKKALRPGRPALGAQKRQRLSLTLEPGLLRQLEAQAKRQALSHSRLAETLLAQGLQNLSLSAQLWQARLGRSSAQVAGLCQALGIKRLSLFGSVLTERFLPDSDVDLLVEFKPKVIKTLFDLGHVQMEFQDFFGRPVDIAQRHLLDNPIRRKEILATEREIYAA